MSWCCAKRRTWLKNVWHDISGLDWKILRLTKITENKAAPALPIAQAAALVDSPAVASQIRRKHFHFWGLGPQAELSHTRHPSRWCPQDTFAERSRLKQSLSSICIKLTSITKLTQQGTHRLLWRSNFTHSRCHFVTFWFQVNGSLS